MRLPSASYHGVPACSNGGCDRAGPGGPPQALGGLATSTDQSYTSADVIDADVAAYNQACHRHVRQQYNDTNRVGTRRLNYVCVTIPRRGAAQKHRLLVQAAANS